ncbi:hypothetical protein [Heyndrickxia sporothermodurans]
MLRDDRRIFCSGERPRWHIAAPAVAFGVIACAGAPAIAVHLILGLLSLTIAVAETSTEDRQAATALIQHFASQHPRVRIKTALEPDRLPTAAALDKGESQLAIVRSDAAAQDGQTLVILRRDAAVFIAPGGSSVDRISKLRGATVALLDGRKLDPRLLDLILTHFGIPLESVRHEVLPIDQLTEAAQHKRIGAVFVVAPPAGKVWRPLYTARRKGGGYAADTRGRRSRCDCPRAPGSGHDRRTKGQLRRFFASAQRRYHDPVGQPPPRRAQQDARLARGRDHA